jgi:hypothetical protein
VFIVCGIVFHAGLAIDNFQRKSLYINRQLPQRLSAVRIIACWASVASALDIKSNRNTATESQRHKARAKVREADEGRKTVFHYAKGFFDDSGMEWHGTR